MSSMKDIKQRVANVSTTKQIMKAMDMVATTKLQKARQRLEGARAMYDAMKATIDDVKGTEEVAHHVFVAQRAAKKSAYVVVTSDKGLCGNYNIAIAKEALAHMNAGKNEHILVIGAKGADFLRRHGKNIVRRVTDATEAQVYTGAERVSERVLELYLSGKVDEVFIAYTHFESTLSHVPRVDRLLPLPAGDSPTQSKMRYEPDPNVFLDHIMPQYLHMVLFAAFSEALASEHAARMVNMEAASKNATEIIDDLNRMYNRKRQAAITQEISEIVGGANILE